MQWILGLRNGPNGKGNTPKSTYKYRLEASVRADRRYHPSWTDLELYPSRMSCKSCLSKLYSLVDQGCPLIKFPAKVLMHHLAPAGNGDLRCTTFEAGLIPIVDHARSVIQIVVKELIHSKRERATRRRHRIWMVQSRSCVAPANFGVSNALLRHTRSPQKSR